MKIVVDHMHEIGDLIERVDKHRGGALILFGAAVVFFVLGLAGLWLARH